MRLENNLGGDNLSTSFRVYIEGVQVPFSSAQISNVYRGLPTATVTLAPWRGFSEITKGYFPKIHIFYRDFNQGLAPYDLKRSVNDVSQRPSTPQGAVEEAQENYNLVERQSYKLLFGGVISSVTDSKSLSGDGGSASVVLNCVHPYYLLNEILFRFVGTNSTSELLKASAMGIMADGQNLSSLYAIQQALAGVHQPIEGELTIEENGGDVSVLSDTMSDNYWRLQGMPGVVVAMWNTLKRSAYSTDTQSNKTIMSNLYVPLIEIGLKYFNKMTGHPIIEGAIQQDGRTPANAAPTTTQTATSGTSPNRIPGITRMSERGKKQLVEFFEGRHYKLYDDANGKAISHAADATGNATIGVGHYVAKTDTTYDGKTLTDQQVDDLLTRDIASAERAVSQLGLSLSQGQFDALVDLTFNVGPGSRGGKDGALWQSSGEPSTIVKLINENNMEGAGNAFMSWIYAGGQVSSGLVARRTRDRAFFLDETVPDDQGAANNNYSSKGTQEELSGPNATLTPANMNVGLANAVAQQLITVTTNALSQAGSGELTSFGEFVQMFMDLIEYDHVIMNSPAYLGIAGRPEVIDHVYKPRMATYYSPICNVILPNMYESMSVNIGTDQVPSRIVYSGQKYSNVSANSQTTEFNNYTAPHSVRRELAQNGQLASTLNPTKAVPGRYEWGSGVRAADGVMPYWYAILSQQATSGSIGNVGNETIIEALKAAWDKLYPGEEGMNPWRLDGDQAFNRLFFTGADVEYANLYARSRSGSVEGVFNPFIIPGYPMDVVDPSPLRESYHGFCTSVSHSIDASGYSATSIGMTSVFSFSEIATCYIPGTYPWLLAQLNLADNLSMYGNTAAYQRACQYYNDVLGVGAADPTILEAYSTGKPIPVKRNQGVWEIGGSEDGDSMYSTTLGNLNLVARNIQNLLSVEKEHAPLADTFIDIDMWNQGSPTVEEVRKGPWVNDQSSGGSTLRGRDFESSAFLDYDPESAETPDPILAPGMRPTNVPPTPGTPAAAPGAQPAGGPEILPKLGKRCSVGTLDATSVNTLKGVHPDLVKVIMKVIETRPLVVTSGYRTAAQQAQANASGRYAQGAGEGSRHRQYPSRAVDMVPCNNLSGTSRAVMENFATYVLSVANSMGVTLRWGGNFSTYDPVHFDLG